ncbi:MAG: hypothetical protein ACLRRT_00200 [Ruthenibacterium lactatiformans]
MGIKYPLSCQAMMLTMAQCFSSAYDITVPVVGYDIGNTAFALKDDGSIFMARHRTAQGVSCL